MVHYPDSELRYLSEVRLEQWLRGVDEPDPLAGLGLQLKIPENQALLGQIMPGSPAEQAGLQTGDRILSADGQAQPTWSAWVEYVRARPDQPIDLRVERDRKSTRLNSSHVANSYAVLCLEKKR